MNEQLLQRAQDPALTDAELWKLLGVDPARFSSSEPTFTVVLLSANSLKIAVIKEYRSLSGLGLKECKDFVESAPKEIARSFTFQEAVYWVQRLLFAGASAQIKDFHWSHDVALCCELAQHPNLSGEQALYFLLSEHTELQRQVALSPHLPKAVLSIVAQIQPANFLQNPVLPLLLLEDPTLGQLEGRAVARLIEQKEALPMLYPAALACSEASAFLARGDLSKLPQEIVSALSRLSFFDVQYALANNKQTPLWVLEVLSESPEVYVLSEVAIHPNVTIEILERLSTSSDDYVVSSVVKSKSVTVDLLVRLSEHSSNEVLGAVAANPKTPAEILARLAESDDDLIPYRLIENPALPAWLVQHMASQDPALVVDMAKNSSASPEALRTLFHASEDEAIKAQLLRNPRCPADLKK